ncbi:hypothetical protein D3C87_988280 [compost metagenome]
MVCPVLSVTAMVVLPLAEMECSTPLMVTDFITASSAPSLAVASRSPLTFAPWFRVLL